MSSTRTADADSPFRQERFASSSVYEPGLLGNLVAKRCKAIRKAIDRALVYWLQAQSHAEGGLQKFAESFLEAFPEKLGTKLMHQIGKKGGSTYNAQETEKLRHELPQSTEETEYLLSLMTRLDDPQAALVPDAVDEDGGWWNRFTGETHTAEEAETIFADYAERASHFPKPPGLMTVSEALRRCQDAASELPQHLRNLCLDPRIDLEDVDGEASVWWFQGLLQALHEYRFRSIQVAKQSVAETTITRQIFQDLDYSEHVKGLVLIEGEQRTGKSKSAEAWVAAHPGQAVYVRLESGKDDLSFFRTIARALGTACSSQMKAQEMRMKIEDMLQEKHLMLVIDEAHFLFPIIARPKSAPGRVDWLRTALVDHGVAVACLSTPQFDRQCAHFEKGIGWNAKQIKGRVKLQRLLPSELPVEDLAAVARKMVPEASTFQVEGLVGFAQGSDDYLAGIERMVDRAKFIAHLNGREVFTSGDLRDALQEALPSVQAPDPAAPSLRAKPPRKARALPLQEGCNRLSDTSPAPTKPRASLDLSASAEAEFEASGRLQFTDAAASE